MASASPSPAASAVPADVLRAELGEIDASTRAPILVFLVFGALWLLGATALALVSSLQLHHPGFLGEAVWFTYGRARPAFLNAFLYGWAFNAAFAIAVWLMARLSGVVLRAPALAVVGGLFWNLGVLLGVAGILAGDSTGFTAFELPRYAAPLLFAAYALIGIAVVATFRFGRWTDVYVSQWYLLAALFWLPWLHSVAQVMLLYTPARGTVQSIVAAWYAYGIYGLWLAPIALAAVYYFLPKLLGRTIHEYGIARMGFWTWGLFASWVGAAHLLGSPVPAWVQAAGTAASLMLLVPVVVIAINHFGTLGGRGSRLRGSTTLRFILFAAAAFALAGLGTAALSLRSVAQVVQFTFAGQAQSLLELYAFFSMAAFGAIYFIVPRLVRREWPSAALITAHFWTAAAGSGLAIACLAIGGWLQGAATNDVPGFPEYVDVIARTVPFLVGHSLALVLLAIGHIAFAVNLGLMLFSPRVAPAAATDLFRAPPAVEVVS